MPPTSTSNKPDGSAVDLLIHERPRILRVKLCVLATQLQERLRIRTKHLESLTDELTRVENDLLPYRPEPYAIMPSDLPLRTFLLEHAARLRTAERDADVSCWQDIASVMSEFLTTWEALEQSQTRAAFLKAQGDEDTE